VSRMPFAIAACLVVLGAFSRLIPHPPNAVAIGALALYAGARLPRGWGLLVPLAAMLGSDLILDRGLAVASLDPIRLTSYGTLAAVALLSSLRRGPVAPTGRVAQSLAASSLFFLTTNLAVWAAPLLSGTTPYYPPTPAGLAACYVAALPFFGNALLADLAGTAALFGLDALASSLAERSRLGRLRPVPVNVEAEKVEGR
jgi:hypothetical protein